MAMFFQFVAIVTMMRKMKERFEKKIINISRGAG
jgi:hypothetical protein